VRIGAKYAVTEIGSLGRSRVVDSVTTASGASRAFLVTTREKKITAYGKLENYRNE
jgi:hypothetical protein